MSETENISKMAEILAKDIFKELKWQRERPINTNYPCINIESHAKKTHPSDIVFSYIEPYTGHRLYVQLDLKSYARSTIKADSIAASISSLAIAVECATISDEWKKLYVSGTNSIDVIGLLFIFNHDGGFDSQFDSFLENVAHKNPRIPSGVKVFVIGPQDIWYLNNIIMDMKVLRGDRELPPLDSCTYYYPDSRSRVVRDDWNCAATIECLKGPWQILKYRESRGGFSLLIYYRGNGDTVQEFVYLIDKLVHFQLVANAESIRLRAPYASQNAAATFAIAVKTYLGALYQEGDSLKHKLEKLKLETMQKCTPNFSQIEIGMEAR
jgi:hypothetical protein